MELLFHHLLCVKINGPEPQPEANEPHGQTLLAGSSCRTAEKPIKLDSEACIEGEGPGWASSAFPSCDVIRYPSSGKSQSLGKHKSVSDSVGPPKSKVLRTAEPCEESGLVAKSLQPSPRPAMEYSDLPPLILDCGSDYYSLFTTMDATLLEMPIVEFVPCEYDSKFLTGLEDLGSLLDITDIR